MRKFLGNLAQFSVVALCFVTAINLFLWSRTGTDEKLESFYKLEVDYVIGKYNYIMKRELRPGDNLFIGSSKTFRHLDPITYDRLSGTNTTTYNLADGNFFPFRTLNFIEILLHTKPTKGVNYFLELTPPATVGENFLSDPILNSVDLENSRIAADYFFKYGKTNFSKIRNVSTIYLALAYKYINPGYAAKPLRKNVMNPNFEEGRGYVSLNTQSEKEVLERHEQFLREKNVIVDFPVDQNLVQNIKRKLAEDQYLSSLLRLAKRVQATGNQIIFFVPPRLFKSYLHIIKAYSLHLREEGIPVIDLAKPEKYPELYLVENSFDNTHLNQNGSTYFTRYLSDEFKRISLSARNQQ